MIRDQIFGNAVPTVHTAPVRQTVNLSGNPVAVGVTQNSEVF